MLKGRTCRDHLPGPGIFHIPLKVHPCVDWQAFPSTNSEQWSLQREYCGIPGQEYSSYLNLALQGPLCHWGLHGNAQHCDSGLLLHTCILEPKVQLTMVLSQSQPIVVAWQPQACGFLWTVSAQLCSFPPHTTTAIPIMQYLISFSMLPQNFLQL